MSSVMIFYDNLLKLPDIAYHLHGLLPSLPGTHILDLFTLEPAVLPPASFNLPNLPWIAQTGNEFLNWNIRGLVLTSNEMLLGEKRGESICAVQLL